MSRPTRSRPVAGRLTPGRLRAVAQCLVEAGLSEPHIVHLRGDRAGAEVCLAPLSEVGPEVRHPLDVLVGFTAPAAWHALGVVASGTAHHGREGAAARIQVAMLVARNGSSASALTGDGGAELPPLGDEPVEGLIADALRRCLGLSTPPPTLAPSRWLTCVWLDHLTAADRATPNGGSLLPTHPLATATNGLPSTVELLGALRRLDAAGWGGVRAAAAGAAGSDAVVDAAALHIAPRLARWADAGCLARLLEVELPSGCFLFEAARALLPAARWQELQPLAEAAL